MCRTETRIAPSPDGATHFGVMSDKDASRSRAVTVIFVSHTSLLTLVVATIPKLSRGLPIAVSRVQEALLAVSVCLCRSCGCRGALAARSFHVMILTPPGMFPAEARRIGLRSKTRFAGAGSAHRLPVPVDRRGAGRDARLTVDEVIHHHDVHFRRVVGSARLVARQDPHAGDARIREHDREE